MLLHYTHTLWGKLLFWTFIKLTTEVFCVCVCVCYFCNCKTSVWEDWPDLINAVLFSFFRFICIIKDWLRKILWWSEWYDLFCIYVSLLRSVVKLIAIRITCLYSGFKWCQNGFGKFCSYIAVCDLIDRKITFLVYVKELNVIYMCKKIPIIFFKDIFIPRLFWL